MKIEDLRDSALLAVERIHRSGVSVFGGEGVDLDEVLRLEAFRGRTRFRRTTAQAIYEAGFAIEKTFGPRHYTIWTPDTSDAALQRLVGAFGPVERMKQRKPPWPRG